MSAEGHAGYHSHWKKYLYVFILLTVLTVAEVIAAESNWAYTLKAVSLSVMAIGKAVAVAYWYMHLDEDTAWMKFIAAVPISAAIYACVVILESLYR
tara:strand:+ start:35315 stop:35605 length:291 start_codon:yes stop_codon:yes gene_type:complete